MSRRNQLVIPLNLEKIVEVSSSVRTLDEICESLDYAKLYNAYRRKPAKNKRKPRATISGGFRVGLRLKPMFTFSVVKVHQAEGKIHNHCLKCWYVTLE